MSNTYIFRTNYFQKTYTWVKRILSMIVLSIGALMIPLGDDLSFLKPIFIALVIFYYLAKPKDDLGLNETHLFHIRKSLIPRFSKTYKYELAELTSIRCGGIHSDTWELVDFFNGGSDMGGFSNTVEMSFKDDSSTSLNLAVSRDLLDKIVSMVYEIKKKNLQPQL